MKNIKLSRKEKKAVEEFKEKLIDRFGDKIVLIKIFGSKVKGVSNKESDIDILVVYKGNGKIKDSLSDTEWKILKKYDYDIYLSALFYSLKEYKNDCKIQTPFIYNINKEGVVLWDTIRKRKS